MHFRSHARAFYAQWGRRYLHPSNPPWKSVADTWLANQYPLGRGSLLINIQGNMYTDIPPTAQYFRECIKQFEFLKLTQDTDYLDQFVEGEPIFFNHRFDIPISDDAATKWAASIGLQRIHNLIDDNTEAIFTDAEMEEYTYTHAPPGIRNTPSVHEWSEDLMQSWRTIRYTIPQEIIDAATSAFDPTPNTYVAFVPHAAPPYYAKVEQDETTGMLQYHTQWIDTFGSPHDTGTYVSDYRQIRDPMQRAAIWIEQTDEDAHYEFRNDPDAKGDTDDDGVPKTKLYIIGPASTSFPVCHGWSPEAQATDVPTEFKITTLAQVTIKRMTHLFTQPHILGARPNCEDAWIKRVGWNVPFPKIWPTLGTPLSDATEEKQWRKMLQRAIDVRNRHPDAPTHTCRLRCNWEESMLHLIQYRETRPLWTRVTHFAETVLGEPKIIKIPDALIFNIVDRRRRHMAEKTSLRGSGDDVSACCTSGHRACG